MLCDRHTTNFAKSQVGFLSFVIHPYFSILTSVIPKMEDLTKEITNNTEIYKTLVDEHEELMKKGNK
jgi:cAMP-specific phosphodiesterase 4